MKTVINRQRHPVTPEGAPAIPPFQTGTIDEELPGNVLLLDAGSLVVVEDEQQQPLSGEALRKRAADLEIEGRSSMSADEMRAAITAAENHKNEEN